MIDLLPEIRKLADQYHANIVDIRRQIHANPELAFEEFETAAAILTFLEENGIECISGVAKTGIVALIKGRNPGKKAIALRADMDALPIQEKNEVDYKSKNEGKMHACGHDVHTSSLLGTAKILNTMRDHFDGTVKLIFQPSEEKYPGGAKVMIEEGV
jgi:amidohydrolase